MKSIWKFPLEITDRQVVRVPRRAVILSVQTQNGVPCIWALVDTEEETEERTFFVYGTGHECFSEAFRFIGTFQVRQETLVFHLFEGWSDE
jgi:hypothetical protein